MLYSCGLILVYLIGLQSSLNSYIYSRVIRLKNYKLSPWDLPLKGGNEGGDKTNAIARLVSRHVFFPVLLNQYFNVITITYEPNSNTLLHSFHSESVQLQVSITMSPSSSSSSSAKLSLRQSSLRAFFSKQSPPQITPQSPSTKCKESSLPTDDPNAPKTSHSQEPTVKTTNLKRKRSVSNAQPPMKNPSANPQKAIQDSVLELPMTDYEREREENIRKNKEYLQNLGIATAVERLKKPPPRPKPKSAIPPLTLPLRRSTRRRPSTEISVEISDARNSGEDRSPDPNPIQYDDSSVLKYMCSSTEGHSISASANNSGTNLVGFLHVGKELVDPALKRIYSVDVAVLNGTERALLAAGGHGGRISVYGTSIASSDGMDDSESVAEGPLMTWKGSVSWISAVRFLKQDSMLLLSSSNDGGLLLWDINKEASGGLQPDQCASPPIVAETYDLHSQGIFGMHELNGRIATASKDSSVGFSRFQSSGITVERTFSGHHSGPVKGISFRDSDILVDCGADNRICILDLRLPNFCTLTIESDHRTGVNVVEWCPSQDFLLLSASRDPELLLYDIRSPKQPLHKLWGHVDPKLRKCSHIYRPAFVSGGMAIATPGQGSGQISLYSVNDGKAISRGFIGYDANLVMCNMRDKVSLQRMWMASKQITQLSPIWQASADMS
eukprot:Gb_13014 [translate_table: standard]